VRYAVEASRGLPLRYVIQAPSCVPPVPGLELSSADFAGEEVETMLGWPEVGGVAEVMDMLGVLDRDGRMVDVVGAGIEAGKLVSGHAFQLAGPALQAYLCAGITSDHENVLPDEVLEKLRAGMTVELRYLIETLLPPVVEQLNALPTMPTNLVLCSDDIFACDLVEVGHIDEGLRRLIAAGLDPVQAIRLATINGAYRLQRTDLGLVGPGRRADIVVLSDLEQVTVADVWVDGRRVASGGRMLEDVTEGPASPPLDTVALAPFAPEDFVVQLDVADGPAAVRTIHMPVFTSWGEATVVVSDGVAIIPDDLLVQASVHRYGRAPGVPSLALLSGWGAWTGAIATTVSHDTHNLQVFGRDPADMALAANTVIATGGGVAVVQDGVVLSSIALPVAGILSDRPVDEVVAAQHEVNAAALTIGEFTPFLPWPIFQTFATSLACLPGPHNTDVGLTDGSTGEIVASILLEPAV
jgi:adenine deaminase